MIQTNLLDTLVKTNALHVGGEGETCGKIRGIYEKNGFIMAILVTEEGKICSLPLEKLEVVSERIYAVYMFWNVNQKIKAIKAIRGVTKMDLKAAKDYVEAHMGTVKVKGELTLEEAEAIKRQITHDDQMECEIRKEF
ncbi:ribosomal protein L7/L12 [Nitrospira sp. BLG_2]|uniref:ribosomal protein L7/L12 n=1 Tax=Nitrospira sp. BLG_2 TaxID=3397507 RepID=UPI003B9B72CF